jgi:hypothetical protein
VPRWSLLLFVIAFAALALLIASERRDEPEPQPERQPPPARTESTGLAGHLRALQRIRPRTAARARPARPATRPRPTTSSGGSGPRASA